MRERTYSIRLASLLVALGLGCGVSDQAADDGPIGYLDLSLHGEADREGLLANIAVRNVFEPSQMYLIECYEKPYELPGGHTFCDELLVLPPGVYEIIVQPVDPKCTTALDHYKVLIEEGQTTPITIDIDCLAGSGGVNITVREHRPPEIKRISFHFVDDGPANKYICYDVTGEGDVRVTVEVSHPTLSCDELADPTWKSHLVLEGGELKNVVSLLSNATRDGCSFSIDIDAGYAIADYMVHFAIKAHGHTNAILFPIHIIDCDPNGNGNGEPWGCSPGYWSNTQLAWPDPYLRTDWVDDRFGVGTFTLDDITLLDALNEPDGIAQKRLRRHAVAALLNAAAFGPKYPYTISEIIQEVADAVALGDAAMDDLKTALNNYDGPDALHCPLPAQ